MDDIIYKTKNQYPVNRIIRSLTPHRVMMGAAGAGGVADFHTNALHLNGTDEYLANTTNTALGIIDDWSLFVWCATPTVTGNVRITTFKSTSDSNNRFYIARFGSEFLIQMFDSSGTEVKQWITTNSPFSADVTALMHIGVTWTGNTTLTFYINGSAVGAGDITETVDSTGTMTDTSRAVYVGTNPAIAALWTGTMHSTDLFNTELPAAAVTAMYDSGNGYKLDLRNTSGNYTQTANLMHYWNHGENSSNLGEDLGNAGTLIDIDANAANITAADIVDFATGV